MHVYYSAAVRRTEMMYCVFLFKYLCLEGEECMPFERTLKTDWTNTVDRLREGGDERG